MPIISPRASNIAIIVSLAACGAGGYYLFEGRASGMGDLDPAPSQPNISPAPHAIPVARPVDVKRPIRVDSAETPTSPATPSLDGSAIVNCHHALRASRPINRHCDRLKHPERLRECQQEAVSDALYNQTMRGEAAGCPSSLGTASGYYKALRAAAQTGDANAQDCFIQGYFSTREDSDQVSKQEYGDYVRLAREYISSGLERGDWGLVRWLARFTPNMQDYMLENAYPFGEVAPVTYYKMNFLLTLGGATDNGVQHPQSIVKIFARNGELSGQQIQDAQAWARDIYSNYFAATPYVAEPTTAFCRDGVQRR